MDFEFLTRIRTAAGRIAAALPRLTTGEQQERLRTTIADREAQLVSMTGERDGAVAAGVTGAAIVEQQADAVEAAAGPAPAPAPAPADTSGE